MEEFFGSTAKAISVTPPYLIDFQVAPPSVVLKITPYTPVESVTNDPTKTVEGELGSIAI
jgi:hypothetical protein